MGVGHSVKREHSRSSDIELGMRLGYLTCKCGRGDNQSTCSLVRVACGLLASAAGVGARIKQG